MLEKLMYLGLAVVVGHIILWVVKTALKRYAEQTDSEIDDHIVKSFTGFAGYLMWAGVIVYGLDEFGVNVSPLWAVLSASLLGIGMSFKDFLQNPLGGLTMIFTRDFDVGDTVTVSGEKGKVLKVTLFCTKLINTDDDIITIPNKKFIDAITKRAS